jgi:hypothetical protein
LTDLLTYSAYAKRRGVSVEAVSKAVETGRISTVPGKSKIGRLIDPAVADREWAENTDPMMQRGAQAGRCPHGRQPDDHGVLVCRDCYPQVAESVRAEIMAALAAEPTAPARDDDDDDDAGPAPGTLASSKARKEHWAAETARLKYEELAGKLVDAEAVAKQAFDLGRTIREAIMGIPDRIAGELASETDPHRVHVLLTKELTTALEGLAHEP